MHKESNRPRRIAELLQREVAVLLQRELNDPRIGGVTLTGVEVSRDLASARIYFTCREDAGDVHAISKALNGATGYLRHHLRDRLELRGIPRLRFVHDESVETGARIDRLLEQVKQDQDVDSE